MRKNCNYGQAITLLIPMAIAMSGNVGTITGSFSLDNGGFVNPNPACVSPIACGPIGAGSISWGSTNFGGFQSMHTFVPQDVKSYARKDAQGQPLPCNRGELCTIGQMSFTNGATDADSEISEVTLQLTPGTLAYNPILPNDPPNIIIPDFVDIIIKINNTPNDTPYGNLELGTDCGQEVGTGSNLENICKAAADSVTTPASQLANTLSAFEGKTVMASLRVIFGSVYIAGFGEVLDPTTGFVTNVPEPPVLILLGSGLVGLIRARLRQRLG